MSTPDTTTSNTGALVFGALGVVYGDIGTSPLYALRECFTGPHGLEPTQTNVLGMLSLVFWALIIVVTVKYLLFIMRADNRGEGGILALVSLVGARPGRSDRRKYALVLVALFGASLLYGDGMITPAISVLSAVEGLGVATHALEPVVVPVTVGIIIGLFLVQPMGTGRVGAMFGPVMLLWFLVLAALGVMSIAQEPQVLAALSPTNAFRLFVNEGRHAFAVLGSVVLVVTGGEALYADMGHFGRRPIRLAWFGVVLPALVLNYFGQGALLLRDASAADNAFYRLAPEWALLPLVALATLATIIASQALVSASFSLARQSVQLGYLPRLRIVHTSSLEIGQIYVPFVNWVLMLACIGLVLGFRSSSRLAAAYGLAVTATMVITAVVFYVVTRERWGWSALKSIALCAVFLIVDLAFFGANVLKIPHGGWFPLLVATAVFTLMTTWNRGRELLADRLRHVMLPLGVFMADLESNPPLRVPGTAVFMSGNPEGVPHALLHNLKHNKVLHERNLLLTVLTEEVPQVPVNERVTLVDLGQNFLRITARYGFMETPSVPEVLEQARLMGDFPYQISQTTFFLGRETVLTSQRRDMALWREKLFSWMSLNARSATAYFDLPPNRVVELGAQIEL